MRTWVRTLLGVVGSSLAALAQSASITSLTPQGEVAQVRQVTAKFSEAVVAFGEPRLADPLSVSCQGTVPEGAGRWTSDREWVWDYSEPLPPGTECTVAARPTWKSLSGTLIGKTDFALSTGGPAVVSIQPYDGATVAEDQFFLLRLNGAATSTSIVANAWCEVEGIGDRIALRIIDGATRDQLFEARRIEGPRAPLTLLLACTRPLPSGSAMRVIWGRGIAAAANPRITTNIEQRFRFDVRDAFSAEFSCERERATAPCVPVRPLTLRFSAPVDRELASQVRLRPAAGGAPVAPTFDKDEVQASIQLLTFAPPFAENARFLVELPPRVQDDAGRILANAASFPLAVATAAAPPIAKFAAAPFGIIERSDPVLPVTLRHVQGDLRPAAQGGQVRVKQPRTDPEILAWYRRLARYHEQQMTAKELGLPQDQWFSIEDDTDAKGNPVKRRIERYVGTREVSLLNKEADALRLDLPQLARGDPRPFEVIGIPLPTPGYHVVEIESKRLGQALLEDAKPMFVRTGVLITNLGVHFKLGRTNSAVWVTSLDRATPVEGAQINVSDCDGKRLWSGTTDVAGLAHIERTFESDISRCNNEDGVHGLFITARKTDAEGIVDTAFVLSNWQQGIEPWRFNLPTDDGAESDVRAATVFDRSLLRAGETVSMKHFARRETQLGLADLKPEELPTQLKIVHRGSGQEYTQPLAWQGVRSAVSHWVIPKAAKLGSYYVALVRASSDKKRQREWTSGEFRVEEFRVPLVDARVSGPKEAVVAPDAIAVSVQLNYFSGGPMAKVPARASAVLKRRSVAFDGFEDFSFAPPRETDAAQSGRDEDEEAESSAGANDTKLVADKLPLMTDTNGAANIALTKLPPIIRASQIDAEVTFNDPNGEVATASATIPVWPSSVVLGVKTAGWATRGGKVDLMVVALDISGGPVAGQAIEVRARLSRIISTRKRMVGGFYAYDNRTEVDDLGPVCKGTSDARGRLGCQADLQRAGQIELIATATDPAGHAASAASEVWVTAHGELWFAQSNDDRIDLLPEKKSYEPGEVARLQVRIPFREATALVAVEREGVIETRVITLRGDDPTVEVKVEPEWGPNVYVSVLALRGRIREVSWYSFFTWGWRQPLDWTRAYYEKLKGDSQYRAPTALVDLAKPAFRFGVAALKVGIGAHRLNVAVSTDKPVYQVRDKATARIKVSFGDKPAANATVAFAAVDEGLLALRPNRSWDLLDALIRERAWGVSTATAQSEIIGRRHYGRKAVAAGGGGGRGGARELFDTLLLWKPDVVLDANGEAEVEVPLNDSLTSFRLVAVADGDAQRFGTGSASIRVTQDLQMLSGLPPLVRSGDRFSALMTLRNTTSRDMKVRATLQGTATATLVGSLAPQDVDVPAGAATELNWSVQVPESAGDISWQATAQELNASAPVRDHIAIAQRVVAAVPERVLQSTLRQLDAGLSLPVAAPAGALPKEGLKRGGVVVAAQSRLTGALPGIRRFFETYPFTCLEQITSRAIGLNDTGLWQTIADTLPTYLDRDGLASYFPPRADAGPSGSDTLTAYLLSASHDAGFELPTPARDAMIDGLLAFVEGRIARSIWAPASTSGTQQAVRKLAAIAALARWGRATPRLLGSIELTPNVWPTAAVIDWLRILKAVEGIPNQAARLAEANQILKSRLTYAGTTLKFSNEQSDFWWWLMDSADANAARLILAVLDDPEWTGDLPRMVVGSLARQRGGAWLTTTANLWGALALDKFSKKFENQPVTGGTVATLGAASRTIAWDATPEGGKATLPWPTQPETLEVSHIGAGKPWVTVQSVAAIELQAPTRAGYSIERKVNAVEQKEPGKWSRGDVLRVRLEVDAQSDMTWVVVSDPVPGGATILGSGLGRDSVIAASARVGAEQRANDSDRAWPAYVERGLEAYRGYYEFLPRGKHVVEYTLRLNNPGTFALPPTRVEAMYAPESFGELPNPALKVGP